MPNFSDILKDKKAAGLVGNTAKLEQLRDAPETQKIFSMLSQSTGGSLEQAADQAAKGDTAQLMSAIKQLMKDPEGARLIQQMKQKL